MFNKFKRTISTALSLSFLASVIAVSPVLHKTASAATMSEHLANPSWTVVAKDIYDAADTEGAAGYFTKTYTATGTEASVVPSSAAYGGIMKFTGIDGDSDGATWSNADQAHAISKTELNTKNTIVFETEFKLDSGNAGEGWLWVYKGSNRSVRFKINGGSSATMLHNGTGTGTNDFTNLGVYPSYGTYHKLAVVMCPTTETLDVYVDGVKKVEDASFAVTGHTDSAITAVHFYNQYTKPFWAKKMAVYDTGSVANITSVADDARNNWTALAEGGYEANGGIGSWTAGSGMKVNSLPPDIVVRTGVDFKVDNTKGITFDCGAWSGETFVLSFDYKISSGHLRIDTSMTSSQLYADKFLNRFTGNDITDDFQTAFTYENSSEWRNIALVFRKTDGLLDIYIDGAKKASSPVRSSTSANKVFSIFAQNGMDASVKNIVLYNTKATGFAVDHFVTLKAGAGIGDDVTVKVAEGSTYTLPAVAGSTFTNASAPYVTGWKSGETTYANGATTAAITMPATFTAQWTAMPFVIKGLADNKLTVESYDNPRSNVSVFFASYGEGEKLTTVDMQTIPTIASGSAEYDVEALSFDPDKVFVWDISTGLVPLANAFEIQ